MGAEVLAVTAERMSDTLRHRGPDDSGVWVDGECGIGLGFRRLSILDLSEEGHQPMHSACGRYVIVFNGEVYNFEALRRELEDLGHIFRGHSDTEVILAAFTNWGFEDTLPRLNGMYAFALWDRKERLLHLVRDRLGKKPLYYGWMGNAFLFGSELKALKAHPAFMDEINRSALALYFRYKYIPSPYSIYQNIFKLPPAMRLALPWSAREGHAPAPTFYWSMKDVIEQGVSQPFTGTEREVTDNFEALLRDAVKLRMVADVPLGAFLSSGLDSPTIVALMQAQSERPIRTFTIGFEESDYNEAEHAKLYSQHIGTDHTELYVTPRKAMDVIPRMPSLYDEPFSDYSQIPTYLVSQLARSGVTVILSGDGGDELFGGYNRYFLGAGIVSRIKWMPTWLRHIAAKGLTSLSPQAWDSVLHNLALLWPGKSSPSTPGDNIHKLAEVLTSETPEAFYYGLVSLWKDPSSVVLDSKEPPTILTEPDRWANLPDFRERMMYLDIVSFLTDGILAKVDRASMGVSLEARMPLLDYRVVEFAARVPLHMKFRNGSGKWLIRQVLYKYVPQELCKQPKRGFGIPIHAWLRGPLRDWAESLLDERRLCEEGYLDARPIRNYWAEHLSVKRNRHHYLWTVLMFQAWLEENKKMTA